MKRSAMVLGLSLFAIARSARADEDVERARTLYDEAGQLEKQGQWGAAQDKLRSALRLRETAQLHYALGWAFENDDRLLEAKTEYETSVRMARARNVEEVAKLATQRLDELEKITPDVRVKAAGARVMIDGKAVAQNGDEASAKVDPGSRVIRVERSDGRVMQQTVYVPRGVTRVVEVTADATSIPADQDKKSNAVPWVLVGVGGALVVTSVILFASSSSDASTRDSKQAEWCSATACTNGAATLPETGAASQARRDAQDAADRGNTKQVVGGVLGGVGLVGAVVGTVLLVKHGKEERSAWQIGGAPTVGGGYASAAIRF